ncbi:nuclear transport factor 2-like [Orbicella faveolata]|uniref:nuclear transport factor 2-like n=1 Tax=Orbicella faveolata TaxID=48498 RepID=UPI0009E5A537|nr:nuclear transport factor 2-like [Orbicella faveolata]
MNPNYKIIGESFVNSYYQLFDTNRAELANFYTADSMMTFEGNQFGGTEAIKKKLVELPFVTVKHVVTTVDCQPTVQNGVVVYVVGQLKTDNDPPHSFSQCFLLMYNEQLASYCVLNDMFRLSLHHHA